MGSFFGPNQMKELQEQLAKFFWEFLHEKDMMNVTHGVYRDVPLGVSKGELFGQESGFAPKPANVYVEAGGIYVDFGSEKMLVKLRGANAVK